MTKQELENLYYNWLGSFGVKEYAQAYVAGTAGNLSHKKFPAIFGTQVPAAGINFTGPGNWTSAMLMPDFTAVVTNPNFLTGHFVGDVTVTLSGDIYVNPGFFAQASIPSTLTGPFSFAQAADIRAIDSVGIGLQLAMSAFPLWFTKISPPANDAWLNICGDFHLYSKVS